MTKSAPEKSKFDVVTEFYNDTETSHVSVVTLKWREILLILLLVTN